MLLEFKINKAYITADTSVTVDDSSQSNNCCQNLVNVLLSASGLNNAMVHIKTKIHLCQQTNTLNIS